MAIAPTAQSTIVATKNENKRQKHASARTEFRRATASYRNRSVHSLTDTEWDDFDDDSFGGVEKIR